ncbi:HET-domain-containing protein [Xylariaceae sp. AK1471]|nr:HET-domain-containing protein [Xylariaceae sp. AK1471]
MDLGEVNLCSFCFALVESLCDSGFQPSPRLHDQTQEPLIDSNNIRPHHQTLGPLLDSSKVCPFCQVIVSHFNDDPKFLDELSSFSDSGSTNEYIFEIRIKETRAMPSGVAWARMEAYVRSTNTIFAFLPEFTVLACRAKEQASSLPHWRRASTTVDGRISAIASWLHECRSQHSHSDGIDESFTPRRLVSVGLEGQTVKLVEGRMLPTSSDYVTLSYCWGATLQLQTTEETLHRFHEVIPTDLLPKAYVDAFSIARALGVGYIWINALCIVQDDDEEWQTESAKLGKIFQKSLLTITATESADSSEGCFPPRNDDGKKTEVFFSTNQQGTIESPILVRTYDRDIREGCLNGSIISKCGWTLQEQLLSRRIVSCMQTEVHWQCQACYQTQSGLTFTSEEAFNSNMKLSGALLPSTAQMGDEWWRNTWRLIIENYTARSFTFENDRIPAIASITKHIARIVDDVSILGLWKGSFGRDLAWWRSSERPVSMASSGFPSWSWFSSQGEVDYTLWERYNKAPLEIHTTLLDWCVRWEGVPYVSPVEFAHAEIEGPVLEIPIAPVEGNRNNPPYFQVFGENLDFKVKTMVPWRCCGQFDAGKLEHPSTYTCLLLWSRKSQSGTTEEVFLILDRVHDVKDVKYRRVGLAKIRDWEGIRTFDIDKRMKMMLV